MHVQSQHSCKHQSYCPWTIVSGFVIHTSITLCGTPPHFNSSGPLILATLVSVCGKSVVYAVHDVCKNIGTSRDKLGNGSNVILCCLTVNVCTPGKQVTKDMRETQDMHHKKNRTRSSKQHTSHPCYLPLPHTTHMTQTLGGILQWLQCCQLILQVTAIGAV